MNPRTFAFLGFGWSFRHWYAGVRPLNDAEHAWHAWVKP